MGSPEVERVRRLLEGMGHGVPDHEQALAATVAEQACADDSATERGAASGFGDIVAVWDRGDDGRTNPQSTIGRKALEFIRWTNGNDGAQGEVCVPRQAAKLFGIRPRRFNAMTDLERFLEEQCDEAAFSCIARLLDTREYCQTEIEAKLGAYGFGSASVERALRRALRCGLVDDARFAESFVASKLRRGWGRQRIERELAQRGIDVSCLRRDGWACDGESGELDRAIEVLRRRGVPSKNAEQKLVRHLIGKGYDYSVAISAARQRVSEGSA